MKIRIFTLLAALIVAGATVCGAQSLPAKAETDGANFTAKYANPVPGQIPRLMWDAYGDASKTPIGDQWAESLKDLGVNIIAGFSTQRELTDSVLTLAEKHGLKVMLCNLALKNPAIVPLYVPLFRHRKAVAGYLPLDEPNASRYPDLLKVRNEIYSYDTAHLVLVNLLPEVPNSVTLADSYRQYMEEAISTVRLPLLSFDNYPVVLHNGVPTVRDNFYSNLETASSVAKTYKVPFWSFALTLQHFDFAPPTVATLRFQVFNSLAYGSQGIEYWTYPWYDPNPGFKTKGAPLSPDGERTQIWYDVQTVNREIAAFTDVFLGCEVLGTWHTGNVPPGCRRLRRLPAPFTQLKANYNGVLVSHIRNHGRDYIVLCNHDVNDFQKVRIRWKGTLLRLEESRTEPGKTSMNTQKSHTVTLAPGSYAVFTY